MKKKILPLAITALFLVLGPVSVSVTAEVVQSEARGAFAQWSDGTYLLVQAGNTEFTLPFPPYSLGRIFIMGGGPSIGLIMKELDPKEFKWSLIAVQVSTEIGGHALVIMWTTRPPTILNHVNDFGVMIPDVHVVQDGAMRWASVTLIWDGAPLLENGIGAVSEGIRAEIPMS